MAGDDRLDRRANVGIPRVTEVGDVQLVLVRARRGIDEEVAARLVDAAADVPLRLVRALVDQDVLRLRCSDAVIVDLLVGEGGLDLLALRWLGIAGVQESSAVVGPGGATELHPTDGVRRIAAGPQITDVERS